MKVVILDGTYGNQYRNQVDDIIRYYEKEGHKALHHKLEEKNIAYCTGCWSCWVKTPGRCISNDDIHVLLQDFIQSDCVIYLTENSLSYVTAVTKKVMDKTVPLIHPYIELVNGECHHRKRYDKYPKLGLIYMDESMNTEDFELVKHLYERLSINLRSQLEFAYHTNLNMEDFNYEAISI